MTAHPPMRVVHVGNFKPTSTNGVNISIAGLVRHLPCEQVDVELWHFTPACDEVEKRSVDGVNVFDLPCYRTRWQNFFTLPQATQDFFDQRSEAIDLIHLHSVFIPEHLHVSMLDVPYVLTPHGGYGSSLLGGRHRLLKKVWLALYEKAYVEQASMLHAVSPGEADYLRRFRAPSAISFVPNGIDEAYLQCDTADIEGAQEWTFLGRLSVNHKGLDLLLEGYSQLRARAAQPLPRLTLAGPDFRGGGDQLKALSKKLDIADAVRFPGPVFKEDKEMLFGRTRLFIHTSRWEGLPFALLEALAQSRPVLVTPETNIASYVASYDAGWVVEGTPPAIAEGLYKALHASPRELARKGSQGRALVRDCFTWEAAAAKMADLYESIVGTMHRRDRPDSTASDRNVRRSSSETSRV